MCGPHDCTSLAAAHGSTVTLPRYVPGQIKYTLVAPYNLNQVQ